MGRSGRFYAMGVAVALWGADASAISPMNWSGNASNDWFDTGNWIGGVLPGDTIDVYINATGAHGWPQFDGSASIYTLRLGAIAGASLDILDHSTLSVHSTLLGGPVASASDYYGLLRISGEDAELVTNFLEVGYSGTGRIEVTNGGLLNVAYPSSSMTFGNMAGSFGSLLVTDAGSQWLSPSGAVIGNTGTGRVDILNGAYAQLNGITLGGVAGGDGTLVIDGQDTAVDLTTYYLAIGNAGHGDVTISGGAEVESYERFWLGFGATGTGKLTVTGDGSLLRGTGPNASFTIGYAGDGEALIDDGGTISAYTTQLGWMAGSTGNLVINGPGSRLTGTNFLMVGYSGSGELTLSNGGTASLPGRTVYVGNLAGGTGVINIGAAAGSAAAMPGYLDVGRVQLGPNGNSTLVFNHLLDNYVFAPDITGNGTIATYAGTTVLTGNGSAFTGTTNVYGGKLVANGTFGGPLAVASGGRLGGTGAIGPTTVQAGAVHAPGNSIGTQTINGNYANHGVLEIEATPLASDRLIVNGSVDITGATLNLILSPASSQSWPAIGSSFTVIENDGVDAITGTFVSVTSNLFFLDSIIDYAGGDGNDLAFTFNRNNVAFAAFAQTPNQIAAADAMEMLAMGNPVWNALAMSSDTDVLRAGLDMLSGEVHATSIGVLLEDSSFVRDAAFERLSAASGQETAFWLHSYGNWRYVDGDGNAAPYQSASGGMLTGVDTDVADWRFGLLAGYGRTNLDVGQRQSSADIDSYHVGLYAGRAWGGLNFRSGAAYTWHGIDTQRSVALGGFTDRLSAGYNASTAQGFAEIAYDVAGNSARFEPFANLAYVSVGSQGFSENGGAAALSSGKDHQDATFTTLGFRAKTDLDLAGKGVSLSGTLAWRHAYGDTGTSRSPALAGTGAFGIDGVPVARNLAIVEASINTQLSAAASFSIAYQGKFQVTSAVTM